ncbi:MAG: hypothetical protein GX589_10775 [Deltaproteobacteria bacterium]|nr:hypothetical protein [Deltaproteobacteria bacterium]
MCKFRRSCTVTFALFLALVCFGEFGLAEPERGRLPDGRAFRTGTDGVQLVDYMAELELSIEELNRRVYGLEAEVKEKQERIDRFELTGKADAPLRERDLLGNTSGARSACPEPPPCPVCSATESGFREFDPELIRKERRCAVDLAGVRAELNRSQQQLAETRSALYVAEQRIAQERGTQSSADNQISQLRASFESRIAKL